LLLWWQAELLRPNGWRLARLWYLAGQVKCSALSFSSESCSDAFMNVKRLFIAAGIARLFLFGDGPWPGRR